MMYIFGKRLTKMVAKLGSLCIGIDPHPQLLKAWGFSSNVYGLAKFCDICIKAFAGFAAVKLQIAFFEAYGSIGFIILERFITEMRKSNTLIIADSKRGDIRSTMSAYATAWFENPSLISDAVTFSPYLGFGSLVTSLNKAASKNNGVFVLASTSNQEGYALQSAQIGFCTIAQSIIKDVSLINQSSKQYPGSIGVVIGATVKKIPNLSRLHGPILIPGIGMQGGSMEVLKKFPKTSLLLPTLSRQILIEGPEVSNLKSTAENFRDKFSFYINKR